MMTAMIYYELGVWVFQQFHIVLSLLMLQTCFGGAAGRYRALFSAGYLPFRAGADARTESVQKHI